MKSVLSLVVSSMIFLIEIGSAQATHIVTFPFSAGPTLFAIALGGLAGYGWRNRRKQPGVPSSPAMHMPPMSRNCCVPVRARAEFKPQSRPPQAEEYYWVTAVAFSRDGKLLASGCADGTVRVWDGTPLEERAGRK